MLPWPPAPASSTPHLAPHRIDSYIIILLNNIIILLLLSGQEQKKTKRNRGGVNGGGNGAPLPPPKKKKLGRPGASRGGHRRPPLPVVNPPVGARTTLTPRRRQRSWGRTNVVMMTAYGPAGVVNWDRYYGRICRRRVGWMMRGGGGTPRGIGRRMRRAGISGRDQLTQQPND